MPKLPRVTAKEIISVLEKNGFILSRQSGSHRIYKNISEKRVTVPCHSNHILHPKIIKNIIKDMGITIAHLNKLL